jgi:YD repeat-containing protein
VNLNTWAGQSDVRFRWCFVSDNKRNELGVVVDSIRILPVTATIGYAGGYIAVPQGQAVNAVVTKTGGSDFTTGMTINFGGNGLTGTVGSVIDPDTCNVTILADRTADVGAQAFYIESGSTRICEGIVDVHFPQQLISNRQGGSAQEPPMNGTMVANGVYAHNGEFVHSLPILSIPGRMLPLSAGLTYRSRFDTIGPVGAGWSASFDNRLTYSSGTDQITLYSGGGRIDVFSLQGGGLLGAGPYILPGFFLQLWRNNNGTIGTDSDDIFTIKYAHGSTATFTGINLDIAGQQVFRQTEFSDRYGNKITYEYNSAGQLERMLGDMYDGGVSTTRYALNFSYGPDGRLYLITDYADYTGQQSVIGSSYTGPREWEFVYNGAAQLTEIRLPKTERYHSGTQGANFRTTVKFTYDGNDNLLEVIDARQANESTPIGWLKNHYDGSDRVDYQDVGRDSVADTTHRQYVVYTSSTDVNVVNAMKHRSQYLLNANGAANTVRHYTGTWLSDLTVDDATPAHAGDPSYFQTSYQYDTEFHVIRVDYPRGNRSESRYDITNTDQRSRGNLLRVLSHPGTTSTANLPADQVNGLLAKFSYTSAAQFNLLTSSVGPRAFELKSTYNIVTDNPADYQRDDSSEFTTTNTYHFSAPPFLDGTLQKTTTPTVSTAVSPGTLNNGQYLETNFAYTSFGQVMTATDQAGVVTRYEYGTSGFGQGYLQAVKVGDQTGNPLTSTFSYNSVGRAIEVTDPKGHTYTSFVNQLDQVVRSETPLVSSQMSGGSSAVYYSVTEYDHNGNVEVAKVANIDEYGNAQSPTTINTTYTYNLLDMVTQVTEPIDLSTDRSVSFSYDLVFRSIETVLPEGNRTSTDYDELNRAIKSHAGYDGVNVLKANAPITSEVFYDLNSNVVKSVDGRGNDSHFYYDSYDRAFKTEDRLPSNPNYTTYTYNQAGQVIESVRYGKKNLVTYPGGVETYSLTAGQELGRAESRYDNMGRGYFSRTRARDSDNNASLGYSGYEAGGPGATDGWSTSTVKFRANGQVEETYGDLQYPTKYTYDVYNRLARITDDRDGAGSDDNYDEYKYDANSNVTAVTARLFDDVGSAGNKTVTTTFAFDELNRLVSDTSPNVNGPGTALTRYFKYDSRSNLVRTVDRKSVERITTYDLLNRPVRHKVDSVLTREVNPTTGVVSTLTRDIVSRTIYDKNSNVAQSIDSNGNRTWFRYDLAGRWLQTQHADGGSGTPLKSTAGSGHTITQVGGGVFYSKSGAYDANSNLLAVTDENDTVVSFTYDENDLPLTETGAVAGGNPFNIEGETGLSYAYDGLYRAVYGETHDASNTLTETDSVFNSLGGLERQRQRVHQAHPSQFGYSHAGSVASRFDESGRRFQRTNPGDVTRTTWAFDRKHRPTETWLEYNDPTGGWSAAAKISEYDYLGGGLLHSRQTKYVKETSGLHAGAIFPIVSDFEHDDLLRVTSVRHWRDDTAVPGLGQYRLLGRYDYSYDQNSMMLWEARWHEDDQAGASTTPDEADFYAYSGDNQLTKAAYNVTKFGADFPIDLAGLPLAYNAHFNDDTDNTLTCSDRVYYGRRKSSTRDRVNWYRGAANRTALPSGQNDTTTGPTQKTHYDTSDDPNADPDNPAADGNGSRHNYTVIGKVGHVYDRNLNVLADGTREFRYNYKNQLRHVWRKSDGDTVNTGTLAKYREDAFGRRVHALSYWELASRKHLDTRFELDVNVDADNDLAPMVYVDGGITSNLAPPPGQLDQKSSWDSRIRRNPALLNEAWYFDFLVDVPDTPFDAYLGYVSYDVFELRIYTDRYELYNTQTGQILGTHFVFTGTAGRHNIGIRAGVNGGVWVDGAQLTLPGLILTNNVPVNVGFGTHDILGDPGLVLLENLNYIRSYMRGLQEGIPTLGTPVVTITNFDGDEPITTHTPFYKETSVQELIATNTADHGTTDRNTEGVMVQEICLANGRGITGQVVRPSIDMVSYLDDSSRISLEGRVPGVAIGIHADAVGALTPFVNLQPDPNTIPYPGNEWPVYGTPTPSFDFAGAYELMTLNVASARIPWSDVSRPLTTVNYGSATGMSGDDNDGDQTDDPSDVQTSNNSDRATRTDWEAGNALEDWLDAEETPTLSGTNGATPEKLRGWQKILRELKYNPYYASLLRRVENAMRIRGLSAVPYDPPKKNPDRETRTSWAQPGEPDWRGNNYAIQRKEAYQRIYGGIPIYEYEPDYGPDSRSWFEWANPEDRLVRMWEGFKEDAARRAGDLRNGEYLKVWLGRDRYDRIQERSQQTDMNGNEIGLVGAVLAEPGEALGVREMGDGIEMAQNAETREDWQEAIDTLGSGLIKYGGAVLAVYGSAQAVKALSSGLCFVEGTLVMILADGADPAVAQEAVESGDDSANWCELAPIEKIQVGDWVLTRPDGQPEAPLTFRQVEKTFTNTADELVGLTTVDGGTQAISTVWTTVGHPFWTTWTSGELAPLANPHSPEVTRRLTYRSTSAGEIQRGKCGWVYATDLRRGYTLATTAGHDALLLEAKYRNVCTTKVYNFSVADTHTYFVAGIETIGGPTSGLWVHNRNAGAFPVKKGARFQNRLANAIRKERPDWSVRTGVTYDTPWGKRIVDIEIRDRNGKLVAVVEAKKGRYARYSAMQEQKDHWIVTNNGGVSVMVHEK